MNERMVGVCETVFISARRQPCRQLRARFSLKLDKNRCSAKMGIASEQRSSSVWACRAHLTPIDRIWHSRHDSVAQQPRRSCNDFNLVSRRFIRFTHSIAAALWPSRENLQSLLIVSLNSFLLNESNLNQFSSLKSRLTFIFIVLEESANSCRAGVGWRVM